MCAVPLVSHSLRRHGVVYIIHALSKLSESACMGIAYMHLLYTLAYLWIGCGYVECVYTYVSHV